MLDPELTTETTAGRDAPAPVSAFLPAVLSPDTLLEGDGLEARVQRIEAMVTDIHQLCAKLIPLANIIGPEIESKGLMGLMGIVAGSMGRRA